MCKLQAFLLPHGNRFQHTVNHKQQHVTPKFQDFFGSSVGSLIVFILVILFAVQNRENNTSFCRLLPFKISYFLIKSQKLFRPSVCMQMIDGDPNMEVANRVQQLAFGGKNN